MSAARRRRSQMAWLPCSELEERFPRGLRHPESFSRHRDREVRPPVRPPTLNLPSGRTSLKTVRGEASDHDLRSSEKTNTIASSTVLPVSSRTSPSSVDNREPSTTCSWPSWSLVKTVGTSVILAPFSRTALTAQPLDKRGHAHQPRTEEIGGPKPQIAVDAGHDFGAVRHRTVSGVERNAQLGSRRRGSVGQHHASRDADPRLRHDHDILEVRGHGHGQLGVLRSSRRAESTGPPSTAHDQRVLTGFDRRDVKRPTASLVNPCEVALIDAGAAEGPVRGDEGHSLRVEHHAGDTESPRAHRRDVDAHRVAPRRQSNRCAAGSTRPDGWNVVRNAISSCSRERHAHAGLLRAVTGTLRL